MVQEAHTQPVRPQRRRVRHAGFLLGVGLAALLDAALFHNLLAWHTFVGSGPVHEVEGIFHLAALAAVVGGVYLLWKARGRLAEPAAGQVLTGSALGGLATFNLVEGVVTHHVLGLHHVNPGGNVAAWDIGFLLVNVVIGLLGWRLMAVASRVREAGVPPRGARRISGRIP
jgi:uncharacterized membrane protein